MIKKRTHLEKTTIPLPVLIGETRMMYTWCQPDKSELISLGLKWEVVESLPVLCDTCETLSINCKIEKIALSQCRTELKNRFKTAIQKRTIILEKIRYALYVAESHHSLPAYYRRRTHSEIIEDLFNLSALCDHLKELLEKTGFDHKQSDSLRTLSLELQNEHVALSESIFSYEDLRKRYIRTYHELYTSAQKLRNCAFEVFPPDSPRRQGYYSQYRKTHK
jgi:hypothetical protein